MKKENLSKFLKLEKRDFIIFGVNMVLMFLMVLLQHMHFEMPHFMKSFQAVISPMPAKIDIFDKIFPKLQEKGTDYHLNRPTSFINDSFQAMLIPPVQAGSDFEQASAYIVTDFESGDIIESKNLDKPEAIASL